MTKEPLKPIVIGDLRGGRNGTDPPMSLPFNQATEALNVDWKDATVGRKRGGSTAVSTTGGTAFSSGMQSVLRHVPGSDETAAEFWGIDGAPIAKRLAAGTSFANVTLDDAISTRPQDVVGATLNGKLFLAYDSAVDRLHVYDPNLGSPRVRRVGFATPAAPTAVDSGSGSYAAVKRYYRMRWLQTATIGGVTMAVRRSEPSPAVSITPSGSGLGVDVTRPAAPGEGETHWEAEVSLDNATWFVWLGTAPAGGDAAAFAIASATATDINAVSLYSTWPIAPAAGQYARFPSVKYVMSDGNRLLGAGAWESAGADSAGKSSRVWFTPVLGSTDRGDDERVPNQTTQKNWVDLNENDGGAITGCGGPLNGIPWFTKYRQVWKLRPTGDVTTPYLPKKMRDDIGCISHKSLALGEDQTGAAALYFMSHRGPYRITLDGQIQYLGRDNEDIWRTMNLGATGVVAHSTYYPDLHQWWVWIATGANNSPDTKMMLDVQRGFPDENGQIRGGWAKHTGDSAGAQCSCLFSNTLGASMSRDLKPHVGRSSGTTVFKCDTADLDDNGAAFAGSITSRPLLTTPDLIKKVGIRESTLIGKAAALSAVTVTLVRDFGLETVAKAVSLAPAASETRLVKKVEGSEFGEADVLQVTIGDASANTNAWTVDALIAPIVSQELR